MRTIKTRLIMGAFLMLLGMVAKSPPLDAQPDTSSFLFLFGVLIFALAFK